MDKNIRIKLMSGLANIRLSLSIKKLTTPKINRYEFRKIIDDEKLKISNFTIAKKLDEVFSEYFKSDNAKNREKGEKNSNVISLDEMRSMINSCNPTGGTQLKKSLSAYRTTPVDKDAAA